MKTKVTLLSALALAIGGVAASATAMPVFVPQETAATLVAATCAHGFHRNEYRQCERDNPPTFAVVPPLDFGQYTDRGYYRERYRYWRDGGGS